MPHYFPLGLLGLPDWLAVSIAVLLAIVTLLIVLIVFKYGSLWLQAKTSGVDVAISSLIGMSFRNVNPATIVTAQVMAKQAGLSISSEGHGASSSSLEAHYLAGGNVNRVILSIIAANRAGIDLDFDRATAIDLSGRDLSEAVRNSIVPKVIDCPDPGASNSRPSLSAVAKDGVELLTRVRVTVRTNLDQLIGGATEETIIARVGQGIVSTIGSMDSHNEALASPNRISMEVLAQGIETNTAYEIVSIDVASIDVGRNIGARLQTEQAEADTRVARASAEVRRADAVALLAEMKALIAAKEADLFRAEASIPVGLAQAFKGGHINSCDAYEVEDRDTDSIQKFLDSA